MGRYELLRPLAVGGMAELFLARAPGTAGLGTLVVVKRILPHLAANAEFVKMFLDEARLAAQLHHPNIAQVHDIGYAAGSPFFVMEYVTGKDLREVMRVTQSSGGVQLEHALTIASGVAAGLHYAHERVGGDGRSLGIVHRDVSPANTLVDFEGGVKLVDFGVAKAYSRETETRSGTIKGKIAYMSPEQCRGEAVDRRSDVFSLGVLLWELVTGERLHRGESEFVILQRIVTQEAPPPSAFRRDLPRDLDGIVARALRRDREARFGTAEELRVALAGLAARHGLAASSLALREYVRELFVEATPQPVPANPEPVILDAELPEAPKLAAGSRLVVQVNPTAAPPPATARNRRHWRRPAAIAGVVVLVASAFLLVGMAVHRPRGSARPAPPPPAAVRAPATPPAPPPPMPAVAPAVATPPAPAAGAAALEPVKPKPRRRLPPRKPSWNPDSPFLPGAR